MREWQFDDRPGSARLNTLYTSEGSALTGWDSGSGRFETDDQQGDDGANECAPASRFERQPRQQNLCSQRSENGDGAGHEDPEARERPESLQRGHVPQQDPIHGSVQAE